LLQQHLQRQLDTGTQALPAIFQTEVNAKFATMGRVHWCLNDHHITFAEGDRQASQVGFMAPLYPW